MTRSVEFEMEGLRYFTVADAVRARLDEYGPSKDVRWPEPAIQLIYVDKGAP